MIRKRLLHEENVQLSVTVTKVENLPSEPNSIYVVLTLAQTPKKVSSTEKSEEGKNSYEWTENNNLIFKDFNVDERIKIEVKEKQNDKLIGMTTTSLETLPMNLEISRKLKLYDTKNANIEVKLKAIGFGVEKRLFEVHTKLMPFLRSIHTPTDLMRNTVVIPTTMENFFGFEPAFEALKHIAKRHHNNALSHPLFPVLIVFPGKYLIRETIKITEALDHLVVFGVTDSKEMVHLSPYKKNEPIFEVDISVKSIHFHGIVFDPESTCVKLNSPTTLFEAYGCDISKVWPSNNVVSIVNYEFFAEEDFEEDAEFY
ncbi:hypothetical protein ABK040_014372 [Willaertia magna]